MPGHSWNKNPCMAQPGRHRNRISCRSVMPLHLTGQGRPRNRSIAGSQTGSATHRGALCRTCCRYSLRPNSPPPRNCGSMEYSRREQSDPAPEGTPSRWPPGARRSCSSWRPAPREFRSSRKRMLPCRCLVLWPFSMLSWERNSRHTAYDGGMSGSSVLPADGSVSNLVVHFRFVDFATL